MSTTTIPARLRVLLMAVLATLLGAGLLTALAPSADAATYRYWGYYQLKDGKWAFSPKGANQTTPADGSVEGWRFAVAGETDSRMPRGTVTFDQVCGSTDATDGTKRVAVVLDYGRPADAESGTPPKPVAECAQVPTNATGEAVLAEVASVRKEKSLVCGIDSWPASGCGGEVKTVSNAAKAADDQVTIAVAENDEGSSSTPIILAVAAGVLLLALLAGLLLAQRRRKRVESA